MGARSEDIAAAQAAVQALEQEISLQRTQLARREILFERGAIARETLDEFSFGEGGFAGPVRAGPAVSWHCWQNGTRPERVTAQDALIQQLDARAG